MEERSEVDLSEEDLSEEDLSEVEPVVDSLAVLELSISPVLDLCWAKVGA